MCPFAALLLVNFRALSFSDLPCPATNHRVRTARNTAIIWEPNIVITLHKAAPPFTIFDYMNVFSDEAGSEAVCVRV